MIVIIQKVKQKLQNILLIKKSNKTLIYDMKNDLIFDLRYS